MKLVCKGTSLAIALLLMTGCRTPTRVVPRFPEPALPAILTSVPLPLSAEDSVEHASSNSKVVDDQIGRAPSIQLAEERWVLPELQRASPKAVRDIIKHDPSAVPIALDWLIPRAKEYNLEANLIAVEEPMFSGIVPCADATTTQITQTLLNYRAQLRQCQAASAAAKLFFQLSSIQQQQSLNQRSLDRLLEIKTLIEFANSQGEVSTVRLEEIEQQIGDCEAQTLVLQQQRHGLCNRLVESLGLAPELAGRLRTADDMQIAAEFDREREVNVGLSNRSDIMSAELVLGRLERKTLPIARAIVSQSDSILGQAPPIQVGGKSKFLVDTAPAEVIQRRQQLTYLSQRRRQEATLQIESALDQLVAISQQYAIHHKAAELARKRWESTSTDLGKAGVTATTVALAEIDFLKQLQKSQADQSQWKLALVELRTLQQQL